MFRLGFFAITFATPVFADQSGYGHMTDWGLGLGMMFSPVLWIIALGLVVAGVIWIVRFMEGSRPRSEKTDALAELDLRFARGEIETEDHVARKKLMSGR